MAKGIARLGDCCAEAIPHFCVGGSNNVFVNGYSVARKSDIFTEGKTLTQWSKKVFTNSYGTARVGDLVSCGFKIVSGSENVFAG